MEDAAFSDEFCRFLRAAIPSVDAAELLLTLLREPDRWWSALDAAAGLRPLTALAEGDAAVLPRVRGGGTSRRRRGQARALRARQRTTPCARTYARESVPRAAGHADPRNLRPRCN